ncbi:tetratricopeptide repeat protein [Streptomyces sp. NPDC001389]|uniref:serine/threonine-protein kinase n=1 Tax=unclassified Streptomyces TaxID=2593676 RepID=UPI00367BEFB6
MAESRLIQGRYRSLDLIGRGGMGEVWRARDESLGRQVAVKCLKPVGAEQDAHFTQVLRERFRREARVAASLQHRGVTVVHDFGDDSAAGGPLYLVMELLEGRNLSQLMEENEARPFPVDVVLDIAEQMAAALGYTHDQGVVHRDLKPANIMRLTDGTVKICDFGIARLAHDIGFTAKLTGGGMAMGTPHYMSPEQIAGGEVDHLSDLYSLGCVLYEIATGAPPFDLGDSWSVLVGHRDTAPVPPRDHRPELPEYFERIVLELLAKRPEDRPGDARHLHRRLVEARFGAAGAAHGQAPLPAWAAGMTAGRKAGIDARRASGEWAVLTGSWTAARHPGGGHPQAPGPGSGGGHPATGPVPGTVTAPASGTVSMPLSGHTAASGHPGAPGPGRADAHGSGQAPSPGADRAPASGTGHAAAPGRTDHTSAPGTGHHAAGPGPGHVIGHGYGGYPVAGGPSGEQRILRPAPADDPRLTAAYGPAEVRAHAPTDPGRPDSLDAGHIRAFALSRAGRPEEALAVYAAVADGRARVLGPDHADTLAARQEEAYELGRLGRHGEAYEMYRAVLAARVRTEGPRHPDTLRCRHNLACALGALGRHAEAHEAAAAVAADRADVLGPEHVDTLLTRYEVGYALGRLGRWNEALTVFRQVAAARERILGRDHPDALAARYETGIALGRTGRAAEALDLFRALVRDRTRAYGAADPETLRARHVLGVNLGRLDRWEEAVAEAREVGAARARALGAEHPDTLVSRRELAVGLGRLGRWDQALPIYRDLSGIRERSLGDEHPDTVLAHADEAHCLERLGQVCYQEP